jgi:hypothetical protein
MRRGKVNIKHLSLLGCCLLWLAACMAPMPQPTAIPTQAPIAAPHENAPRVFLTATAATIETDNTIVVNVEVANVTNLFGVEIELKFNPVFLEVVDVDDAAAGIQIAYGDFFAPEFVVQNQADNVNGTVTYVGMQVAPTQPVTGSGALATIVFRGKAQGPLELELTQTLLSTPDGQAIPVETVPLKP